MNDSHMFKCKRVVGGLTVAFLATVLLGSVASVAQSQQMEEKLMAIRQAQVANKQKLAQYTWQETETISIKGEVKDTKIYQVQMVNGQQQKTLVNNEQAQSGGGGRLKERIIDKKKEEYQEYGQSIGALAKQYTTPNPDLLMQAKQQGNLSIVPGNGTVSLVIKSYVKPGDSVTFAVSEQTHSPLSVQVNSYLNDPKDAVTISAQFAQLPDGTNHVATATINGVSKQLTVNEQNSNYQRLEPAVVTSSASDYSGQGVPATAEELQSLVAPIALYPDALVAQILNAATYPDQVAVADNWMQQNKNLTGTALATAVNGQSWDPSVKALTEFPSVLNNMAQNLAWTSQLGEDYHNQQSQVMAAIQTLRADAKAAGNLKSGSQITVVQQSPQTIVIQPTNPQVVYVPQYNPTVIYGTPYVVPNYTTTDVVATGLLSFGAGMAVGAMMSDGCCGWGYSSWNCNWYGGGAYYHGAPYYGNAAWHGGYYGNSASAYGPYGSAHAANGYNPSTGTYARGASTSTAYGSQRVGQAYNPYTGAYGATHQGSNAYSNWGSSTFSKNGQTADTQHYSNANGTVGTAETSSGNKYATANGNAYKNTGSGWQKAGSSEDAHGWGGSGSDYHGGSSAFSGWGSQSGGDSGWGARSASASGWGSRGGGGGWGGGGFRGGGGGFRR